MMTDSPIQPPQDSTVDSADGAHIRNVPANREVSVYPLFESELDIIGTYNTQATLYFSAGAAFISAAVTLFLERQFTDINEVTELGRIILTAGPWAAIAVGLIAFIIGSWLSYKKGSLLDKIKRSAVSRSAAQ